MYINVLLTGIGKDLNVATIDGQDKEMKEARLNVSDLNGNNTQTLVYGGGGLSQCYVNSDCPLHHVYTM